MKDAFEAIKKVNIDNLFDDIDKLNLEMKDIEYSCLGCKYCYGAEITNLLNQAFPETENIKPLEDFLEVREVWPNVPGEYFVLCDDTSCPVAISTLGSVELVKKIAKVKPKGLCLVGKTETENIGVEKVIKNIVTNSNIRYLLLVGIEAKGHNSGDTFMALFKNGVDANMKVIGSTGKRPILVNVTRDEIEDFRQQIQIVDMIGSEDLEKIQEKITELLKISVSCCGCISCRSSKTKPSVKAKNVPVIEAKEPEKVELDKAGYFVIIPQPQDSVITVEHYSYENKLLRIIKGIDSRAIYWTIIENEWVTQLSHAAYIGKELAKAELSIKLGFKYVQEGA